MKSPNPKVSIVLPTYNGALYLAQAIDGCLNQTYQNIELIIVDDCSTDETPDIVRSYHDPRIRYVRNKTNQRLPRSLNVGFALATGEYLPWTSDDNYYEPQAIEVMLQSLLSRDFEFVYCNYFALKADQADRPELVKLPFPPSFRQINPIRACFLYSRNVMKTTGDYDPKMELVEDYDYWIRVWKKFPMLHLEQPLYYYRYHSQSLYSTRYWEVEVAKFLVRMKYDIADTKECAYGLKNTIVRKRGNPPLYNLYARIFLFYRIQHVLRQFKNGELDFNESKSLLSNMVNGVKKEGRQ